MSVTAEQLDTARRMGKVWIGGVNRRAARCLVCRVLQATGKLNKLWIDGIFRGFICGDCW